MDSSIIAAGRIDEGHYSIDVHSIKPSAKIIGVYTDQSTSIYTKLTRSNDIRPTFTASESKKNSFTNYAATLYASATVDNKGTRHWGNFANPKLKISIIGNAEGYKASLILPAGEASEIEFSRTGSGDIQKDLGLVYEYGKYGLVGHIQQAYKGHGKQTITTMSISKDGKSFTVVLDNPLVINNPSSVNQ